MNNSPLQSLKHGLKGYEPFVYPLGDLLDPIVGQPTPYGTPYYAYGQAVLALEANEAERSHHLEQALLGVDATLSYLKKPTPRPSSLSRDNGTVTDGQHLSLCWRPLVKTILILDTLSPDQSESLWQQIASLGTQSIFDSTPPNPVALAWISGEWLRAQADRTTLNVDQFDAWLGSYFEQHILLEQGFFQASGYDNAQDLLARYYLAEILEHGYEGLWQSQLESLMEIGFKRGLNLQLSNGALASAKAGSGLTWTLSLQYAYFMKMYHYFQQEGQSKLVNQAHFAAERALMALNRFERPDDTLSPIENIFPASYRIGYEADTLDGQAAPFTLSFLADAVQTSDISQPETPSIATIDSVTYIDQGPAPRVIIHHRHYSLQALAAPDQNYDGFGLVDLTFGAGKRFHFASSVRHTESNLLFNLGLALRSASGLSKLTSMAQESLSLLKPIERSTADASFILTAKSDGAPYTYELMAQLHDDGAHIEERTPDHLSYKTLLIPYLRNGGWEETTQVDITGSMIRFTLGHERVCMEMYADVEYALHLPYGHESKRGHCGLIRIDLAGLREGISYRIVSEA
ncbi:MAG: hypothetical protein AAF629_27115 [Chloroflexota bacterium]